MDQSHENDQYVTLVTGGPMKYYNRRRVRKVFAQKLQAPGFEPIKVQWYQTITCEIIAARHRQGMSQASLASLLGTAQSAISQLETGKSNPTVELLDRVLTTLKLSMELTINPKK